jgi:hypothetical protein
VSVRQARSSSINAFIYTSMTYNASASGPSTTQIMHSIPQKSASTPPCLSPFNATSPPPPPSPSTQLTYAFPINAPINPFPFRIARISA